MVQELRGRDVARERQARGSFRKMMGSPVGTKKKKGGILAYENDCV